MNNHVVCPGPGAIYDHDHYFKTPYLKPLGDLKPNSMWSLLERRGKINKNAPGDMTKIDFTAPTSPSVSEIVDCLVCITTF